MSKIQTSKQIILLITIFSLSNLENCIWGYIVLLKRIFILCCISKHNALKWRFLEFLIKLLDNASSPELKKEIEVVVANLGEIAFLNLPKKHNQLTLNLNQLNYCLCQC